MVVQIHTSRVPKFLSAQRLTPYVCLNRVQESDLKMLWINKLIMSMSHCCIYSIPIPTSLDVVSTHPHWSLPTPPHIRPDFFSMLSLCDCKAKRMVSGLQEGGCSTCEVDLLPFFSLMLVFEKVTSNTFFSSTMTDDEKR